MSPRHSPPGRPASTGPCSRWCSCGSTDRCRTPRCFPIGRYRRPYPSGGTCPFRWPCPRPTRPQTQPRQPTPSAQTRASGCRATGPRTSPPSRTGARGGSRPPTSSCCPSLAAPPPLSQSSSPSCRPWPLPLRPPAADSWPPCYRAKCLLPWGTRRPPPSVRRRQGAVWRRAAIPGRAGRSPRRPWACRAAAGGWKRPARTRLSCRLRFSWPFLCHSHTGKSCTRP
mmetsp:Transcript_723/g.1530  ORF Transcript_723/g.1530 Transcript_723/m.1530 type:complete len:226 (+) Transcript_723:679-1356(+)